MQSADETVSHDHRSLNPNALDLLFIRWVWPQSAAPITWLDSQRLVLGRDAGADVCLSSLEVSRRHAELSQSGPLWIISDLDSKNGLYANGRRSKSVALAPGDVLRLGDYLGVVGRAPRGTDVAFADLGGGICGAHLHRNLLRRVRELAPLDLPIVLEGETGTGKQLFVRALHEASGRNGPLLAVASGLHSGLRDRPSPDAALAANGGTFVLDDVTSLPLDMQAGMPSVIENGQRPSMSDASAPPVDVRFVATTQIPLSSAVANGSFRADLRARLEGAVIRLPPLRECRDIVPDLLRRGLAQQRRSPRLLSLQALERACLYDWPMNIRELDTLARRLSVGEHSQPVEEQELAQALGVPALGAQVIGEARGLDADIPGRRADEEPYDRAEVEGLLTALARYSGNVTKAAAETGMTRQKAYRMLRAAGKVPRG